MSACIVSFDSFEAGELTCRSEITQTSITSPSFKVNIGKKLKNIFHT